MKRQIKYLIALLGACFPLAQAAQAPAVPADANHSQGDCTQMSDNWVVDASTSLRVTVISCQGGVRIVADRKIGNASVETESRTFNIPNAGVNEVVAISKDAFDVNFLEVTSYANPSLRVYSFYRQDNRWLLQEMSFQATQSCNGEAGLDADYYDVNYQVGKVEVKKYKDCGHFRTQRLTIRPASILLENFDPSDERLSPFQYD